MAGTVTLGGFLNGLPLGQFNVGPFSITANTGNNLQVTDITLVNGFNPISVPTWAVGMIIIPAVTNAVAMTLKGITGDTGLPLALTVPSFISWPASPPATVGLTSTGAGATITSIVFF